MSGPSLPQDAPVIMTQPKQTVLAVKREVVSVPVVTSISVYSVVMHTAVVNVSIYLDLIQKVRFSMNSFIPLKLNVFWWVLNFFSMIRLNVHLQPASVTPRITWIPWTQSMTGCKCSFDPLRMDCACCQNYGCQCGESNKNQVRDHFKSSFLIDIISFALIRNIKYITKQIDCTSYLFHNSYSF